MRMTDAQLRFLDVLRTHVPAYVPVIVNSSRRTPSEQANALRAKLAAGATIDDLRKLYGYSAAIEELVQHPADTWSRVITDQVARGVYLSRHLRSDGLDISVRKSDGSYMPKAWQDMIVAAALRAGAGRAFIEGDPQHVHIERIGANPTSASGVCHPEPAGTV